MVWPERVRQEKYRKSPKGVFVGYKKQAVRRGIEFSLSDEQLLGFWQKPCTYCGSAIPTIGLDRVNNSIGYQLSNVVACCTTCNMMKKILPADIFVEHCKRIADFNS